jgi:hypothetical protein
MRSNTRIFRVIDRLQDLHTTDCRRAPKTQANLVYPITGSTGMAEVVRSYIELETITDLVSVGSTTFGSKSEIVTFSDDLQFTTTLDMGASASWTFQSAVGSVRLTNATLSASVHRSDVHNVVVALARDAKDDPDRRPKIGMKIALRNAAKEEPAKGERSALPIRAAPTLGIRDKKLQNFLTQRMAVARNRVLFELERRRHVNEDRTVASRVLGKPVP